MSPADTLSFTLVPMSVQLISQQEYNAVCSHIVLNKDLDRVIERSSHFSWKAQFMDGSFQEKKTLYTQYLMHHLMQAGVFAYVAQYPKEAPNLTAILEGYNDCSVSIMNKKSVGDTIASMKHIDYNLSDNNGNMYCDPGYYEMFNKILNTLLNHYFDDAYYKRNEV